jgi:hypothetical protein
VLYLNAWCQSQNLDTPASGDLPAKVGDAQHAASGVRGWFARLSAKTEKAPLKPIARADASAAAALQNRV